MYIYIDIDIVYVYINILYICVYIYMYIYIYVYVCVLCSIYSHLPPLRGEGNQFFWKARHFGTRGPLQVLAQRVEMG